jgi:hypothetical protein
MLKNEYKLRAGVYKVKTFRTTQWAGESDLLGTRWQHDSKKIEISSRDLNTRKLKDVGLCWHSARLAKMHPLKFAARYLF